MIFRTPECNMTRHNMAFVFTSFNTLLCLTWTWFIVYMEQKKILIRHALWHAATVLTKILFVYCAKIACPCHHHYAGNPMEGHICQPVCQSTHKDADCFWSEAHENPFKWIKQAATQAPVSRYFNPAQETCFSAMHQTLVLEPHSFKMASQWHTRDSLDTKCNYALIK